MSGDEPFCIVREIRRIAGAAAADVFVREFGGTRVYFPSRMTPEHWIAKCIGFEAAKALVKDVFPAGMYLFVRLRPLDAREKKQLEIKRLSDDGASANEIARQVGCHIRTVHLARARFRNQGLSP